MQTDRQATPSLRVAQFIEALNMGGAENLAVRIAGELAAAGHESHLIVAEGPGALGDNVDSRVRTHYLSYRRTTIKNPATFIGSVRTGWKLLSGVVDRAGIQVVQSHLPGANFWGLPLEWRQKCAVLATVHNNQEFNYGDHDHPFRAWLRRRAYLTLLKHGHGMIAVSDEVKTSLLEEIGAGPELAPKIAVVTNAVPLPGPLSEAERQSIRDRFDVGTDTVMVLAAGRFCEQKNFKDLVAVAGDLKVKGLDFKLVIGGEGELHAEVKATMVAAGLEDHMILPGNLQDLDRVMLAADIFVMTSLWEGLPLVLLEAMAAGLPTAAYSIPGITEVIDSGTTGLLTPVSDPKAMSGSLEALIGDIKRRRTMGETARLAIESRYSFPVMISKLEDLYRKALS